MSTDQDLAEDLKCAVERYVLPEDRLEFMTAVQSQAENHYRTSGQAAAIDYIERVIASLETEFEQFDLFRDAG